MALAPAFSSGRAGRRLPLATMTLPVCGITDVFQLPVLQSPCCLLSLQRLYPVKQCDHEPWKMRAGACKVASSHLLTPCHQG